jgi:hypothetical protein
MLILTLEDNRKVCLIDSGCDLSPRPYFPWLGQISPTFGAVLGDSESDCHEYLADATAFGGQDNTEMAQIAKDIQADEPGLSEDEAWNQATEGCLALNGGAEWINQDDWGFWVPSVQETKTLMEALKILRACDGDEEHACSVLRVLGMSPEVRQ